MLLEGRSLRTEADAQSIILVTEVNFVGEIHTSECQDMASSREIGEPPKMIQSLQVATLLDRNPIRRIR